VTFKKTAGILFLLLAAAGIAPAQNWDTSGNGMLTGSYYFRQVFYVIGSNDGSLSEAVAMYGSLTFDGKGTYTGVASFLDSGTGLQPVNLQGTYSIAASGYGFITNPLGNGDYVYGLVNQSGIFIASDTETQNGYNDLMIAAPLASPAPTVANFNGSYTFAGIDLSSGSPQSTLNYMVQMNPDGVSSVGTTTGTAYLGGNGTTKYTLNISGARYIASGGAMVATFPNSNSISGQKYLYISPDGNFVFGGSPQGFDMMVGVRASSTAPAFGGLYYQAGIDQDESLLLSQGFANLDTYFGSFSANNNNITGHQRLFSVFNNSPLDYTYSDSYSALSNGAYSTPLMNYVVGQNGVRIGSGIGPYLGINVAIPAPSFSGSGVYLNPTGIVNAASYAPFTAGVSAGELITLYGTGLANSTVTASTLPLPTSLGDVQVTINGVNCPIYYITPTQLSVIVPYEVNSAILQIQVNNNGATSNTVTDFASTTSPGVFSIAQNGLGYGAVVHQDGTLVTSSSPAVANETVSVYLTGLGAVSPKITDGAVGPSGTLSQTSSTIAANIGATTATVGFAGLAPGIAGEYQVNLTIPSGLTAGDNYLNISGPDSYTSEVLIPIGGSGTTSASAIAQTPHARPTSSHALRKPISKPKSLIMHFQSH
jgi:uncharacterized protein (TIGR03437 family)